MALGALVGGVYSRPLPLRFGFFRSPSDAGHLPVDAAPVGLYTRCRQEKSVAPQSRCHVATRGGHHC